MFKKQKLIVLYDGNCGFCMAMVRHFSKLNSNAEVEWRGVFPGSEKEKRELKFRILEDDSKEHIDTDARLLLLKAYPRYRLLAALLSLRVFRIVIDPIFAFIAAHRYRIASAFGCGIKNGCEFKPEE